MSAREVAEEIVTTGVAPNAAAGAARRVACKWGRDTGGETHAFFDLASLTKPMTAVAVALSGLDPKTLLAELLPEVAGTPSADVSIELLLAHRAGLEAHVPLWEELPREGDRVSKDEALIRVARSRRVDAIGAPPAEGFAAVYSDLGYFLAGEALARAVGASDAGDAIERLVVRPLGLLDTLGTARGLAIRGVMLTECAVPTEVVAWRGGEIRGRVHDENAWVLSGDGGSGHAGMFGTIDAVLTFGESVLDALDGLPTVFAPDRFDWLVRERGPRDVQGGTLRAGFDGKSAVGSSAGERLGRNAFGHLGFTGTSLWIDPDAKVVVALLTNRVHPSRDHVAIRAARPRAHDALFTGAFALSGDEHRP